MTVNSRGPRRPNGDGTVTKRKDGRWSARYYIRNAQGQRVRQSTYGRTKQEALKKMRKEQNDARNGTPSYHNGTRVRDYLEKWVESPTIGVRESTRYLYRCQVHKHLIPRLGDKNLAMLTVAHVQEMIDSHLSSGGSVRHAQILRNVLSSALRVAKKRGLVSQNVARDVEIPTYSPAKADIWNKDEVCKFREFAKKDRLYPIFELLLTYGLRRGEVLGLTWGAIDFDKNLIHIRQQLAYVGSVLGIHDLKTKKSYRDLVMLPHIREMLMDLARSHMNAPDNLMLMMPNNTWVKPTNIGWAFKRIRAEAELRPIRIHDFRHMVATFLADDGVPQKDVMGILGHASATTTLEHYQHSTIDNQKLALQKYANSMGF